MKSKRRSELSQVTSTPYRCTQCGNIQLATYGRGLASGNCNRVFPGKANHCESDEVIQCGPEQKITFVLWSDVPGTPKPKVRRIK